jgi:hypothetical protein
VNRANQGTCSSARAGVTCNEAYQCHVKRVARAVCGPDDCSNKRDRITPEGTCSPCGDYEQPTPQRLGCYRPICNARQELTIEGICVYCPAFRRVVGDRC